jgi:hypothetical protein
MSEKNDITHHKKGDIQPGKPEKNESKFVKKIEKIKVSSKNSENLNLPQIKKDSLSQNNERLNSRLNKRHTEEKEINFNSVKKIIHSHNHNSLESVF